MVLLQIWTSAMPGPAPEQIIEALERTGFILEYKVAQILRSKKMTAYINYAYPDPETGKSREIDVLGSLEEDIKRPPVNINLAVDLIIECKSSPNPFVLVGERRQEGLANSDFVVLSFDPYSLNFKDKKNRSIKYELDLTSLPGSWQSGDYVGYQLIRMHQQSGNWKADNDGVYDSILYPMLKAWKYQITQLEKDEDHDEERYPSWQTVYLDYLFPIVVVAGPVFTVDVTTNPAEVKEVGWSTLKRTFHSEESRDNLRVDVVSFDHLENYLDSRILKIAENAANTLRNNIHLFDVEWLTANLGEPENADYHKFWLNGVRANRKK